MKVQFILFYLWEHFHLLSKEAVVTTDLEKRTLELFKMISNHTRFMIIIILGKKDHNVSQLKDMLGKDITTVSRHLRLLRELDIVSFRTVENKVFYHLKKKGIINIIKDAKELVRRNKRWAFACLRICANTQLKRNNDFLKLYFLF